MTLVACVQPLTYSRAVCGLLGSKQAVLVVSSKPHLTMLLETVLVAYIWLLCADFTSSLNSHELNLFHHGGFSLESEPEQNTCAQLHTAYTCCTWLMHTCSILWKEITDHQQGCRKTCSNVSGYLTQRCSSGKKSENRCLCSDTLFLRIFIAADHEYDQSR